MATPWTCPPVSPSVTAMGGTEFSEGDGTGGTQYWSGTNNSDDRYALSYIPEMVWNDTVLNGFLAASGGGVSKLFPKPAWQNGAGVPADGHRDVPDLAFSASADHDGYLICSQSSCVNGYRKSDQTLTVMGGDFGCSSHLCRRRDADCAEHQRSPRQRQSLHLLAGSHVPNFVPRHHHWQQHGAVRGRFSGLPSQRDDWLQCGIRV